MARKKNMRSLLLKLAPSEFFWKSLILSKINKNCFLEKWVIKICRTATNKQRQIKSSVFSCDKQLKKWRSHSVRLFVFPFVPFCQTPLQFEYPYSTSVGWSRSWLCFPTGRRKEGKKNNNNNPHLASSRRNDPTCLKFDNCLVGVWNVFGNCLEGVWRVSGGCLVGVKRLSVGYLEYGLVCWVSR